MTAATSTSVLTIVRGRLATRLRKKTDCALEPVVAPRATPTSSFRRGAP